MCTFLKNEYEIKCFLTPGFSYNYHLGHLYKTHSCALVSISENTPSIQEFPHH